VVRPVLWQRLIRQGIQSSHQRHEGTVLMYHSCDRVGEPRHQRTQIVRLPAQRSFQHQRQVHHPH
jgi:hypothetical protein